MTEVLRMIRDGYGLKIVPKSIAKDVVGRCRMSSEVEESVFKL